MDYLLFITHQWNQGIAENYSIWKKEGDKKGLKTLLVIQNDTPLELTGLDNPDDPSYIIYVKTENIQNLYPNFVSPWASSHVIILWVWKHILEKTDKNVWVVEYDFRARGDFSKIWKAGNDYDFLANGKIVPMTRDGDRYWLENGGPWLKQFIHDNKASTTWRHMCMLSHKFLTYLDTRMAEGCNGQDEAVLGTLALEGEMKVNTLQDYFCPSFSCFKSHNDKVTEEYLLFPVKQDASSTMIFHPIKSTKALLSHC